MNTGVYCIRNLFDGKEYIGSAARSIKRRWQDHIKTLRSNKHRNYLLQTAWNACGEMAFEFNILEECPPEKCIEREQWWINDVNPIYNICRVAGSWLGRKHTPEARAKMCISRIGYICTSETRAKLSAAGKGRRHSDAAKEKCRIAKLGNKHCVGRRHTLEYRVSMIGNKRGAGVKRSIENIEKLRAINMGNKYSLGYKHTPETLTKMRAAKLGKKKSAETCAKMSAAAYHRTPEHQEKINAALRAVRAQKKAIVI